MAENLSETSEPGEHILEINTTMKKPSPNADTPTANLKIEWAWPIVENAETYEISLAIVSKSESTTASGWIVQEDLGVMDEEETTFEFTSKEGGYYQLSVVAKNPYQESEAGTHVVFIDTSLICL